MKKIMIFLCSMIMLICTTQICFANDYSNVHFGQEIAEDIRGEKVGELTWTPIVELWHYSGGYWKSNWFKQQYNDNEMSKFFTDITQFSSDISSNFIDTKGVTIEFTSEYDDATKAYIQQYGIESLGVEVEECVDGLFYYNENDNSDPLNPQIKITESGIVFKATPIFYIDGDEKYQHYISELDKQIPIPARGYGINVYSMYAKNNNLKYGRAEGCFEADPSRIEYSDILDINGNINSNKYLYIVDSDGQSGYLNGQNSSGNFPSSNMRIGQGTFANAGAVGIFYEYPVQFRFYAKKPSKKTNLTVKYWDKVNNKIIWQGVLDGTELAEGKQTALNHSIIDWDGYTYEGWKVVTPESVELTNGVERDVTVELDYDTPEKVLNVEFIPIEVEVTQGTLKRRVINTFTGEVVFERTDNASLPTQMETTQSWLATIANSVNCAYDFSNCEITDFYGNNLELKRVETINGRTNFVVFRAGNLLHTWLTKESPEVMITFYISPRSGVADILADCANGSITWREQHSHTVTWTNAAAVEFSEECRHTFTYEVHLEDIECKISPDTLKSGYGFDFELTYGMSKVSSSDGGGSSSHCDGGVSSSPKENVTIADTAVFAFPDESYTVSVGRKEKFIQPHIFNLEAVENTGSKIKFNAPVSEISVNGERKIFTAVSIAGTADSPVTHYATVQIRGGGVSGTEFCYNISVPFTINGNMYEDGLTM